MLRKSRAKRDAKCCICKEKIHKGEEQILNERWNSYVVYHYHLDCVKKVVNQDI